MKHMEAAIAMAKKELIHDHIEQLRPARAEAARQVFVMAT